MPDEERWWSSLDALVIETRVVVDRPRGSAHPRFPDSVYPVDYGYLADTSGGDGAGIDVWLGQSGDRQLVAVACCVDRRKKDLEMKLLLGCSAEEMDLIRRFLNQGEQSAVMLVRPSVADA